MAEMKENAYHLFDVSLVSCNLWEEFLRSLNDYFIKNNNYCWLIAIVLILNILKMFVLWSIICYIQL